MITRRPSRPIDWNSRKAPVAAATASSIVAWIPSPSSVGEAARSASARRAVPTRPSEAASIRRLTRSMISWMSRSLRSLIGYFR